MFLLFYSLIQMEQIVINLRVAGSKSVNSLVKKYGILVARIVSVFFQLAKCMVINIFFTVILAGFTVFHSTYSIYPFMNVKFNLSLQVPSGQIDQPESSIIAKVSIRSSTATCFNF